MRCLNAVIIFLLLISVPVQALAAASYDCNGFTLEDDTIPSIEFCEANLSLETVISSSICILRAAIGNSMFKVYCGLMEEMKVPLQAALTLWIIFYAIAYMFGINNTNGKDLLIRIMKIVFIFAIATNAELFFEFLYRFFVHGLLEGFSTFLFELDTDDIVDESAGFQENIMGIFGKVDELFQLIIGEQRLISLGVLIMAFATTGMGALVSLLVMLGVLAMIQAFFRILITYAVAILALSFLLMFAPLFLGFALFERTTSLFQGWMAAIVSYIVQPMIVMVFIFLFASVGDMHTFIEDLQTSEDGSQRFNIDAKHSLQLVFQTLEGKWPSIEVMDGTEDEDATEFRDHDFVEGVFFALSFLILNSVMNSFMKKVPSFAQILARFQGQSSPPIITQPSGFSWVSPRGGHSPHTAGIHTPEVFTWPILKGAQNYVSRGEGVIGKGLGRLFQGPSEPPSGPTIGRGGTPKD